MSTVSVMGIVANQPAGLKLPRRRGAPMAAATGTKEAIAGATKLLGTVPLQFAPNAQDLVGLKGVDFGKQPSAALLVLQPEGREARYALALRRHPGGQAQVVDRTCRAWNDDRTRL